jgi:uncharacterized protein (DUF488 family)
MSALARLHAQVIGHGTAAGLLSQIDGDSPGLPPSAQRGGARWETMGMRHTADEHGAAGEETLVSIGYEGKTVDDLVAQLLQKDVHVLVDVRLTPLSRKPGLSKTRLSEALAAVGIRYVHHRALGNPKDNRAGFRAGEPQSRARYHDVLKSAAATDALAHVCELLNGSVVALLCFEHDHAECHRDIVVRRLLEGRPSASVVHL